jgi:hypothetical protein
MCYQHEIIANKFVNIIASTVQEFHTGESINSGYPMQAYLDLAWAGLVGTSIYKNYPNDQNHKIMLLEEELRIELLQKHIIALEDQNHRKTL